MNDDKDLTHTLFEIANTYALETGQGLPKEDAMRFMGINTKDLPAIEAMMARGVVPVEPEPVPADFETKRDAFILTFTPR